MRQERGNANERVLVAAAIAVAVAAAPGAAGGPATELLPDLDLREPRSLQIVSLPGEPPRFRLGFESRIENVGRGPLVVLGRRANRRTATMQVRQVVRRSDGSTVAAGRVGVMRYVATRNAVSGHPDHEHWHLLRFVRYELRPASGRTLARDRKTGFCLGDRYAIGRELPGKPPTPLYVGRCGLKTSRLLSVREGISVGYGDDYAPLLEGQSFDVTSLAAGRYVLVHRVNGDRRVRELNYGNNESSLLFRLSWPRGRNELPAVELLAACPNAGRCRG